MPAMIQRNLLNTILEAASSCADLSTTGFADTMEWFEAHGAALKVESDNRVFPQSDDSQTIIDCLINTARRAKVEILTNTEILMQ